jgi:hypothetical protein
VSVPTPQKEPLIKLPTTTTAWICLVIIAALDAWSLYKGNDTQASVLTGIVCMMLGMSREQAAVAAVAVQAANNAASHAQVAADVAVETAAKADEKLDTALVALKDIQDNPAMPGTPGWMDQQRPNS